MRVTLKFTNAHVTRKEVSVTSTRFGNDGNHGKQQAVGYVQFRREYELVGCEYAV